MSPMQTANLPARRVLVYRREILPLSETFVLAQVRGLRRYQPHLFGMHRVTGLSLDGVPVHTLGNGKLGRAQELLFRYCGHAPSLLRTGRKLGPALIHAHFAFDGSECLPLAESLRVPLMVTLYGWDVTTTDDALRETWSGRKFLLVRPELQKKASMFLCVSNFIRQQALKQGYPAEKLVVHHLGVDTTKLVPAPVRMREPIVLFVARLVEKKGLTYLLRALGARGRTGDEVTLVVIGDGPLRLQHEKEAAQLGVKCNFLGGQPNHVVHDWMRRAQVLALPSVRAKSGDREGLGVVLCEAFALGLPVVAFDSGGIGDAVREGCGLLAHEGDSEDLARQLMLLLENEDLRAKLAANARRHAVQNFDLAKQTEMLEQLYDRVAGDEAELQAARTFSLAGAR
jgi:colanic acid/amylovoran biosynthesis glycosyltransferase